MGLLRMLFTRSSAPALSVADAARGVRDDGLVLVDVREPRERAGARPAGSRHIPLRELDSRLGELPADRRVAFICQSGARSALAARAAGSRGLEAANVRGGILAWAEAGLPLESGPERRS